MPLLDVTSVLNDADISDAFSVIRRTDTVGANGRTVPGSQRFDGVIGVVTAGSANDLSRGVDYQYIPRILTIVTRFAVMSEVQGRQPDLIVWRGDQYVVTSVDLYPHFGPGFYQVKCESMDKTDVAFDTSRTPSYVVGQNG